MSRSSRPEQSYLQDYGNNGANDITENAISMFTTLPPFGSFSHSDQEGGNRRDVLMPIQQNVIGSSSGASDSLSSVDVSSSSSFKSNNTHLSNTSSSILSASPENSHLIDYTGMKNYAILEFNILRS